MMAYKASYGGTNSGLQVGQNLGPITVATQAQSETTLNQDCLRALLPTNQGYVVLLASILEY